MTVLKMHAHKVLSLLLAGLLAQACSRGPRLTPDELAATDARPDLTGVPELAWEVKLPSPPAALLSTGAETLMITTHRGELYTFDLETGMRASPLRQPLRKSISAQLVDTERPAIYIASSAEAELRAYSLADGKMLWKMKRHRVTGPMALMDGLLLTASRAGKVSAVDVEDGHILWQRQLRGRIYQGVWRVDSLAVVLTDGGILYAFRPRPGMDTSEEDLADYPHVWRHELGLRPNAVLAAGSERLLLGDSDGQLVSIRVGREEPDFQVRLDAPIYSRPLITDQLVVVATSAGEVTAWQASDGAPVWRVQGNGLVREPLLASAHSATSPSTAVLVPFARGELLALELATGRELWRHTFERPLSLVKLTPGGVVAVNRRNELSYLRPKQSSVPQRP